MLDSRSNTSWGGHGGSRYLVELEGRSLRTAAGGSLGEAGGGRPAAGSSEAGKTFLEETACKTETRGVQREGVELLPLVTVTATSSN